MYNIIQEMNRQSRFDAGAADLPTSKYHSDQGINQIGTGEGGEKTEFLGPSRHN